MKNISGSIDLKNINLSRVGADITWRLGGFYKTVKLRQNITHHWDLLAIPADIDDLVGEDDEDILPELLEEID